ncbi:MAG: hypothetical protein ACYTG0_07230 [Planctomycetota bacterium]|jgi:hypothetical protein
MKKTLVLVWVLLPVAMVAWHYGPGQAQLARDRAGEHLRAADAENDFQRAAGLYAEAAKALPQQDHAARNRLRLAQACSHVRAGEMIEGQEQLEQLLGDLEKDEQGDDVLEVSARHELATASYYAAWLMRLEGATADEWKPEAERARQQFRLLAERDQQANDGTVEASKKNLEATIRLEQMDLSTLKAMPLPKDCPQCKNLSQRKRKQCQSRCRGQGKKKDGKQRQDARQMIRQARGAGLNERTGTGS